MSVSVLATVAAIAAAPAPSIAVTGPIASPEAATAAISIDGSALPLAQAGAAAQSEEPGPSTELAESLQPAQTTDPGQAGDPASTAQPDSQLPGPAGGQSDIIVTGRRPSPGDPLEELNSESFEVAQSVDESFVAPVAFAYGDIMPRPVRKGLRNFLHNLGQPVVFLNYLLQLKPGKAAETLGRFAINTTLGWGGVIDVAKRKPFNLPHRSNGFANTLGFYGVKPGPYFYLPLVGSTTLRDFLGDRLDLLVMPSLLPKFFGKPQVIVPVGVLSELGRRLEFDDELQQIRATKDPYVAARTHYLQKRQAEIDALRGRKAPAIEQPTLAPPLTSPAPPPALPASVPEFTRQ